MGYRPPEWLRYPKCWFPKRRAMGFLSDARIRAAKPKDRAYKLFDTRGCTSRFRLRPRGSDAEWRIPAHRMKMRQQHMVRLATQSVAILRELYPLTCRSRYELKPPPLAPELPEETTSKVSQPSGS